MVNDSSRMMHDLQAMVSTIVPDIDLMPLTIRLEEVLTNYEIQRKSNLKLENDLPEKIDLYLASKKLEGSSELTIEGYKIELRLFSNHCKKATALVTTHDIRSFLASFDKVKMSTLGKKLSVLKSFFGWLVREEVILRDPTAKVLSPKKPKRLPKGLSIEELEIVRESCKTLRQRALIEVMYSTGCRLSEIADLNKQDINFQGMNVKVIGKGDIERIVYLSFKAIYHLKKYLKSRNDECEALFVTERKPYRRLKNRSIQADIDKIEKVAQIPKNLTPHVMRHTFGSLSMDAGIELADLQHLMGHSNPSTTLVYASVSEERKKRAFEQYHVQ